MAKIDLTSREWCELVFEGKNKAYGAYEMRQTSPSRHNKATIIVMIFVLIAFSLPALLKIVVPKQEKEVMTEVTELTNLEAPEEKTEEIKKPDLPPPPPLLLSSLFPFILSLLIPETSSPFTDDSLLPSIFPYDLEENPSWVIINLGTNDASYTRGIHEREQRFQKLYIDFIQTLKTKFPNAKFLLCYGLMEETLLFSVQKVAEETSSLFLRFETATEKDGFCFASHPNKASQLNAAKTLIHFILTRNEETL